MPAEERKRKASGSRGFAHARFERIRLPTPPWPRTPYVALRCPPYVAHAESRRNVPEINKCWNLLQKQTLADFLFKRFLKDL